MIVGNLYRQSARKTGALTVGKVRYLHAPATPERVVRVVTQWQGRGPRNVLVEVMVPCYRDDDCAMYACSCRGAGWRGSSERYVRPFRGLRRLSGSS
jgi:hypothetical protein